MVKDLCFEVIEKCLNNCLFCSSNSNCNKKQIIEFKDFKRVIDYFMNTGGILELSISGGEPFLHPDILKMVEYSKSLGIRTVVFTSGVTRSKGPSLEDVQYLVKERDKRLEEVNRLEPDNEFLKKMINRYYDKLLNPSAIKSWPCRATEYRPGERNGWIKRNDGSGDAVQASCSLGAQPQGKEDDRKEPDSKAAEQVSCLGGGS